MTPRPVDRLFVLYLTASGLPALLPGAPAAARLVGAAHALALLLLLRVGPARPALDAASRRAPRLARIVADWYPLLAVPLLYTELRWLNQAVHHGRFFDATIIAWEQSLFGGQPSRELAAGAPSPLLSEALHVGYLLYYLIIYVPPLLLYLAGHRDAFRRVVFAVMLTFFVHYVFFVYLPVQGPRYLFPPPGGALADGAVYRLTHRILEVGSSQGAAFPSSHVGVSMAMAMAAAAEVRWLGPFLLPAAVAVALGAVYGGFHYAIDAIAGMALGAVAAIAAPAVRRSLAGRGLRTLPDRAGAEHRAA